MDRLRPPRGIAVRPAPRTPGEGSVLRAPRGVPPRGGRHGAEVARRRTRLPRPDPATSPCDSVALPNGQPPRRPRSLRHHGAGASRALRQSTPPHGVLSVRHRRDLVALLSLLRAAPRSPGTWITAAVRIPVDGGGARRGLGRFSTRPRGPGRSVGRADGAWLSGARRPARRVELRPIRARSGEQGRPVGVLRRRTRQRLGR